MMWGALFVWGIFAMIDPQLIHVMKSLHKFGGYLKFNGSSKLRGFCLRPREIVDILGHTPLTRREIWEILADRQGFDSADFPRFTTVLSVVLNELGKSNWVKRVETQKGVAYTGISDGSLADNYPFSDHFLARIQVIFDSSPR